MLERLPDWVEVARDWIVAVIVGVGGITVIVLICGILVWFISYMIWLFKTKE